MYNSEHGQDRWLNENIFLNKREGTFVEVGALDGILHSNSYFFEKELGWSGICIEPNPEAYERLLKNRNCICIRCAISDRKGKDRFMKFSGPLFGWSGLTAGMEDQHLERVEKHVSENLRSEIEVECLPLNDLLDQTGIRRIDYLSLDVEGMEYRILETFDFEKFDVEIFDIENNFFTYPVEPFMISKGYKKIMRLGVNDIFRKVRNEPV